MLEHLLDISYILFDIKLTIQVQLYPDIEILNKHFFELRDT